MSQKRDERIWYRLTVRVTASEILTRSGFGVRTGAGRSHQGPLDWWLGPKWENRDTHTRSLCCTALTFRWIRSFDMRYLILTRRLEEWYNFLRMEPNIWLYVYHFYKGKWGNSGRKQMFGGKDKGMKYDKGWVFKQEATSMCTNEMESPINKEITFLSRQCAKE